ncbi:pentatricopeptide repeat-containing protein At5g06540-like [Wolffia australiana]
MAGLGEDDFIANRILSLCADPNRGCIDHAQRLLEQIRHSTPCILNTMMKALLLHRRHARVGDVYRHMLLRGISPDNYTFPYLLKACIPLRQDFRPGQQVHGHVLQLGLDLDIFVGNTLLHWYSACGDIVAARRVFDEIPQRDVAAWTALICGHARGGDVVGARELFDRAPRGRDCGVWGAMVSGYVQNNCFKEGLALFREMQLEKVEPDEGVLVAALTACARLGALDLGAWIHRHLGRARLGPTVRLWTALVDMYFKCGEPERAAEVFNEMPQRDVVAWNAMITGSANLGDGLRALGLLAQMMRRGFTPDETTFLAVLTACSHAGLVEDGLRLFRRMKVDHEIELSGEHYACVAGFLARAGLVEEAQEVVAAMPASCPASEEAAAWRGLLSATWRLDTRANFCSLDQLDGTHSGGYSTLSNTYRFSGHHRVADQIKIEMRRRGVVKTPGCSCVEVNGKVHEFVAGDEAHLEMDKIHDVLGGLTRHHTETMIQIH